MTLNSIKNLLLEINTVLNFITISYWINKRVTFYYSKSMWQL